MDAWLTRISVACDNMENHKINIIIITNKYNDDNMMYASVWFEFFGGLFIVNTFGIWEGNITTESEIWIKNIYS